MLHHVGIEIRPADVDRAVEFFALLGFERVEPPLALAGEFTWLERGGTQIHLMHTEQPTVPERGHLAVVVANLDETVERLHDRGFQTHPGREHWGAARVHAIAPGGHRVELMAAAPPPGGSKPMPSL
jgi:catechol 2,3-dioxygenase-like lactoylglutathione lyase family enzyme